MSDYLHNHPEFKELLRAVSARMSIDAGLVEKDYWMMHVLYGLTAAGFTFELKGGTSLSKGYGIIHRFSEDIDIRIEPPKNMDVKTGKNQTKPAHNESRKQFYDWLVKEIKIAGIAEISRDHAFDNETYTSGGIRLIYTSAFPVPAGIKEGILLEVGFDDVAPNRPVTISSWALDFTLENKMAVKSNKALNVSCYDPGYTLVEKLQAIVTKFRKQQESGSMPANFIRHYYDVAYLLQNETVQSFIGTDAYRKHVHRRFSQKDQEIPLCEHPALLLDVPATRDLYRQEYQKISALYYLEQPPFEALLKTIRNHSAKL